MRAFVLCGHSPGKEARAASQEFHSLLCGGGRMTISEFRSREEVVDRINQHLTAASEELEKLSPEDFADPEAFWRTSRAITEAGSLVVAERNYTG